MGRYPSRLWLWLVAVACSLPVTQNALYAGEVASVEDLTCAVVDGGDPSTLELSWTNGSDYTAIRIYNYDELVDEIEDLFVSGETAFYTTPALPPQTSPESWIGLVQARADVAVWWQIRVLKRVSSVRS